MTLRETIQEHAEALRTRLEKPLPPAPPATSAEVARAIFALMASLLMVMLGFLLLHGLVGGPHDAAWYEFVAGFVLIGVALQTTTWALLAHAPGP